MRKRPVLDCGTDLLADRAGAGQVGVGQDHDELLAAIACDEIRRPQQAGRDGRCHRLQAFIAPDVAEGVVVGLEVVHIDEDHRQGGPGTHVPCVFHRQHIPEVSPVGEPGEGVGERNAGGLLDRQIPVANEGSHHPEVDRRRGDQSQQQDTQPHFDGGQVLDGNRFDQHQHGQVDRHHHREDADEQLTRRQEGGFVHDRDVNGPPGPPADKRATLCRRYR